MWLHSRRISPTLAARIKRETAPLTQHFRIQQLNATDVNKTTEQNKKTTHKSFSSEERICERCKYDVQGEHTLTIIGVCVYVCA